MARGSSSSSTSSGSWKLLQPAYYLRRPWRMALLCIVLLCTTFMIWDRRSLIEGQEQEDLAKSLEELSMLRRENSQLAKEVGSLRKFLREKGLSAPHEEIFKVSKRDAEEVITADDISNGRREKVKAAMIHAWSSYEKYAWGYDELLPFSKSGGNDFGGLGATIIDSLDTLFIMGLKEEFDKARNWVAESLNFNKNYDASMFETTIRVLGGLLSAYDLSGDEMFLTKAKDIADRLLPAWNTETGIPLGSINLAYGTARNPGWTGGSSVLADLGTEQVELIALTQRTGDPKYKDKAEKVIKQIKKIFPQDGLVPIYINPHSGETSTSKITFGAMGDSFYEYLLKVWVLGNKTEPVKMYREMWEQSMEGMKNLVRKSSPSSFTYLAERYGSTSYIDKMDELACFAPGMLALGALTTPSSSSHKASEYLDLAKELARTCYEFYRSTPTKLAGENYEFRGGQDMQVGTAWNILRPETVESMMYMYRVTGDKKYQDWGWDIFEAFEKQSRVECGYVGLRDVRSGEKDNKMQSFFLAETLKYLYLLFSPKSVISLDEWVFNTEAHPIRIVARTSSSSSSKFVDEDGATNSNRNSWESGIVERLKHRKQRLGRLNDDTNT